MSDPSQSPTEETPVPVEATKPVAPVQEIDVAAESLKKDLEDIDDGFQTFRSRLETLCAPSAALTLATSNLNDAHRWAKEARNKN